MGERAGGADVSVAGMLSAMFRAEVVKAMTVRYLKMTALVVALTVVGVAAGVGVVVNNSVRQWGKGWDLLEPPVVLLGCRRSARSS